MSSFIHHRALGGALSLFCRDEFCLLGVFFLMLRWAGLGVGVLVELELGESWLLGDHSNPGGFVIGRGFCRSLLSVCHRSLVGGRPRPPICFLPWRLGHRSLLSQTAVAPGC